MSRARLMPPSLESFPAEDLYRHPGHLIRRAQQALNQAWSQEVSRTLTSPQFAVLNALLAEPELDQRTLGERVDLDRSTVAELVARLTSRALVEWTRHSGDGRRKMIRLTPRGFAVVQDMIPRTRRMTRHLVRALSPGEEEELLRLLTKVVCADEESKSSATK